MRADRGSALFIFNQQTQRTKVSDVHVHLVFHGPVHAIHRITEGTKPHERRHHSVAAARACGDKWYRLLMRHVAPTICLIILCIIGISLIASQTSKIGGQHDPTRSRRSR